ncbi:MAG: hypothetical protein KH972_07710 [Peptostreptococcaceae bacterium]|nr:hypothetical protein [Peptostreptococcaceae bacterium]
MCKNYSLLDEIEKNNIILIEDDIPFENLKGLYFDNNIIIDKKIIKENETNCILAEELGHYFTSTGNILMNNTLEDIKQEKKARDWAVSRLITLDDLIEAIIDKKSQDIAELAENLEVTEDFVIEAIKYYERKYGLSVNYKGYKIQFNPYLKVKKLK